MLSQKACKGWELQHCFFLLLQELKFQFPLQSGAEELTAPLQYSPWMCTTLVPEPHVSVWLQTPSPSFRGQGGVQINTWSCHLLTLWANTPQSAFHRTPFPLDSMLKKKHLDIVRKGQRRGGGLLGEEERHLGGDWVATTGLDADPLYNSDSCPYNLQTLETPWTT